MKSKISLLIILFFLISSSSFSQEKSKKELRKEQKEKEALEQQSKTKHLVDAKAFVFVAQTAFPRGTRSINLRGDNYFVKFQPDLIESVMPFFGRGYSGVGYSGENGLMFKGKPKSFEVKKTKKKYQIDVMVDEKSNDYDLSLTVDIDGNASLSIASNNRSNISYQGYLEPIKKEAEKE